MMKNEANTAALMPFREAGAVHRTGVYENIQIAEPRSCTDAADTPSQFRNINAKADKTKPLRHP